MKRLFWILLSFTILGYLCSPLSANTTPESTISLSKKEPKKKAKTSEINFETYKMMFPNAMMPSNDISFLSLDLSHFTAESIENQYVILDWSVEEMSMLPDEFVIERWSPKLDWVELQTINGVKDNSTINAFSFLDRYPEAGNTFYRLKFVDENNKTYCTDIKTVITYDKEKFSFSTDYDNASVSLLNHDNKEDLNSLNVLDLEGNNVTHKVEIQAVSVNQRKIILNGLSSGMYLIKTNNFSTKHFKL